MKSFVVLAVLAVAAPAMPALAMAVPVDDILGRTDGLEPITIVPSVDVQRQLLPAESDSIGPMVLLDSSAVGLTPAEGVQSRIEGARGDSAWLVVWHDKRRRADYDIFAARLTSAGVLLDSVNIVISGGYSEENTPAVAFDGTNWLVVWSDWRGGIGGDIYGARVAQDGHVIDTAGFKISDAFNTQTVPAVVFNGTNYLVTWNDYRSSTWEVYCGRVTPDAQVLDPNGIPLSTGGGLYPEITSNGSDWLVTWHDDINALIMAGRVGPDGTPLDPNGFVVGKGSNDRYYPDAAFDGTNYFVVWQDRRQGTSVDHWSIYGARIAPDGTVLDPTGGPVANNNTKYEGIPQVWFTNTAYFVTWKDDGYGNLAGSRVTPDFQVLDPSGISLGGMPQWFADVDGDGTNWLVLSTGNRENGGYGPGEDACATRVTPAGVVLDPYPNIQLALSAPWQHRPAAAFDGERWLAVWVEQKALRENDIRGVVLDAQGVPVGPAFTICGAAGYQSVPAVGAGDSGWLVAWQDYRTGGQLDKLYAARVTRSGEVLDPDGLPVATSSNVNRYPAIAFDGTNWIVVFWTWVTDDEKYHIYGARVTPSGSVLDPNGFSIVQAEYGTGWNNHISLGLAFDGMNYLMVWPDYRNGQWDIYGARVTPSGDLLDPDGFTVCRASGDQDFTRLAFGSGRYLAAWHDTRAGDNVYATLVDPEGASPDTVGIRISTASAGAFDPAVTFAGENFLVGWTDESAGDRDIFLARVSSTGDVLDPSGVAAAATRETEEYPAVAGGGPADQALVLMHSYASAPWQCSRIWGAVYSEYTGPSGVGPVHPEAGHPGSRDFRIWPNPLSAGFASIHLNPGFHGSSSHLLSVFDVAGRLVLQSKIASRTSEASLDMRHLPAGLYFVRLDAGPHSVRQKLVIQR